MGSTVNLPMELIRGPVMTSGLATWPETDWRIEKAIKKIENEGMTLILKVTMSHLNRMEMNQEVLD